MTYILIFVGLILFLYLWSFLEGKIIVNTKYTIKDSHIAGNKDISFLLLSDLHNNRFGKNNRLLCQKILEAKPDFVIIAGDLITKRKPCYPGNAYDLIKELANHYPIYYAYGNHEQAFEDLRLSLDKTNDKELKFLYESWCLYKEKLVKLGVNLLDNESITFDKFGSKITITGLSLSKDYYSKGKTIKLEKEEINHRIGKRNNKAYHILIAHNPVYFKDYISWGADLILSGHVHGGLVRIPFIGGVLSPQFCLFPKYDSGLYSENGHYMIISRGLGTHSYMPRFLNPPELLKITLKAK